MRISRPPPRFSPEGEVYVAKARRIKLFPDAGDPEKLSKYIARNFNSTVQNSKCRTWPFFERESAMRTGYVSVQAEVHIGETSKGAEKEGYAFCFSPSILSILLSSRFVLTQLLAQGNRHIRANHAKCCCLDSKPSAMEDYDFLAKIHEAAGCANSSDHPNADFVDVGYDSVLVARFDMEEGTEVLVNYSF